MAGYFILREAKMMKSSWRRKAQLWRRSWHCAQTEDKFLSGRTKALSRRRTELLPRSPRKDWNFQTTATFLRHHSVVVRGELSMGESFASIAIKLLNRIIPASF